MNTKTDMLHSYSHPRAALTVDCVVFATTAAPRVLLIQRDRAPFEGRWALPGGFVDQGEGLSHAARRELAEETGLLLDEVHQGGAFGELRRDPRGPTVSIAFYGVLEGELATPRAADDARAAAWFPLDELPPLAFDHAEILRRAQRRYRDDRRTPCAH